MLYQKKQPLGPVLRYLGWISFSIAKPIEKLNLIKLLAILQVTADKTSQKVRYQYHKLNNQQKMQIQKLNQASMVLRYKRIHKPGRTFSGYSRIFVELCKSKVQLGLPHKNFINEVATPETVYYITSCWSPFFQCFRKTTHIILRISWVYWENLAQAWCFKVIVVNSESFCCCMQSDLISSPLKYTGRGITSSHFSVRH